MGHPALVTNDRRGDTPGCPQMREARGVEPEGRLKGFWIARRPIELEAGEMQRTDLTREACSGRDVPVKDDG